MVLTPLEIVRIVDYIDNEKYVAEPDIQNPDISIEIQKSEILGKPFFSIPFLGMISIYKSWICLFFAILFTMGWVKF